MTQLFRSAVYRYFINLDERGEFYADVRNVRDRSIFEIKGFEIFEDGWMRHKHDLDGLKRYRPASCRASMGITAFGHSRSVLKRPDCRRTGSIW